MRNDINRNKPDLIQGVAYTGYGTSSAVQALEMARSWHESLDQKDAQRASATRRLIEQWFRWVFLNEQFSNHLDKQADGVHVDRDKVVHNNILECANSNLDMSQASKNYVTDNRPLASGSRDDFATFTNG